MELTLARSGRVARAGREERVTPKRGDGSTDAELVAESLRGKPDAYGELVRRHQTAVYNVVYRLTGEPQTALDLTQDAFVRAYHALRSFDRARPFGPWINRVATNVTLDWLACRRLPTVPLGESDVSDDARAAEVSVSDLSTDPERLYLAREQRATLREAMLALPVRYRAVVELRHFQDLSYQDIAATLNLPLSDVKSHLFRARRLLRQWLEDHE